MLEHAGDCENKDFTRWWISTTAEKQLPADNPTEVGPAANVLANRWLDALENQDIDAWQNLLTSRVREKYGESPDAAFAGWRRAIVKNAKDLRLADTHYAKPLVEGESNHLVFVGVDIGQNIPDTRIRLRVVGGRVLVDDL